MKKFIYDPHLSSHQNWTNWVNFRFQRELIETLGDYWQIEIEFNYPDEAYNGTYTIKTLNDFMKQIIK